MIPMIGIFMLIVAFSLFILLRIADSLEEENRMMEAGMDTTRLYSEALADKIARIRRFRHDAAGLLQAIEAVSETEGEDNGGSVEKQGSYAYKTGLGEEGLISEKRRPGAEGSLRKEMPLLDAILSLKEKQCGEAGIDFHINLWLEEISEGSEAMLRAGGNTGLRSIRKGAGRIGINETDLCLLVQNLLENAYEANLRIPPDGERKMSVDIRSIDPVNAGENSHQKAHISGFEADPAAGARPGIAVTVTNNIPYGEKPSFVTRKDNPELHGIGMKIIDDIIRRYDGSKNVSVDRESSVISIEALLTRINAAV